MSTGCKVNIYIASTLSPFVTVNNRDTHRSQRNIVNIYLEIQDSEQEWGLIPINEVWQTLMPCVYKWDSSVQLADCLQINVLRN